jgi:hypothetical protein
MFPIKQDCQQSGDKVKRLTSAPVNLKRLQEDFFRLWGVIRQSAAD